LRKRRSTRIVQAVPLSVAGVDALGRPFLERTSTLIINCHGCRYQSKHYVLKNMWVTLEVPHPETGQPPRTVRGRVAWIQRPRTVRQLFQVALELELPGNAWGIAFPPEDWFPFPDASDSSSAVHAAEQQAPADQEQASHQEAEGNVGPALSDFGAGTTQENPASRLRSFPPPANTTDASMQLARQITRLLADARQQIQAAAREAALQAVSAEHRISAEQWEQQFAADRDTFSREMAVALDKIREQSATLHSNAQTEAAEALKRDLPRWLAPQLEELAHDLAAQISQQALAERHTSAEQTAAAMQTLRTVCNQAEQLLERLRQQSEAVDARITGSAESVARASEEAARRQETAALAMTESLQAKANEIQEAASGVLSSVQQNWQNQLAGELEAADARVQIAIDNAIVAAQVQAAESLNEHANAALEQFQLEAERLQSGLRDAAAVASSETDLRYSALRDAANSEADRIDEAIARASESVLKLESFPARIETAQHHALIGFQ